MAIKLPDLNFFKKLFKDKYLSRQIISQKEIPSLLPAYKVYGEVPSKFVYNHKKSRHYLPDITINLFKNKMIVCGKGILYSLPGLEPHIDKIQYPNYTEFLTENIDQKNQVKIDNISDQLCVSLFRPGDRIYGHWLVDILPRVWLVEHFTNLKPFYLVRNRPAYTDVFFDSIGVSANRIISVNELFRHNLNNVLILEKAVHVSNLRFNQFFSKLIAQFGKCIVNHVNSQYSLDLNKYSKKKLFISRGNWTENSKKHHRCLINRKEVENIFSEFGYEIISPENFSMVEQIAMFQNAKVIAGEDGSGLHNSLFGMERMHCINLRSSKNGSLIQGSLCSALNQSISYIFGSIPSEVTNKNRQSDYIIEPINVINLLKEIEA